MADETYVIVPGQPIHPNHLPDLRYVLATLQVVLPAHKRDASLRGKVEASINAMRYIIERTEQAQRADASGVSGNDSPSFRPPGTDGSPE